MDRNELVALVVIALAAIVALTFWGYHGDQCRVEAIKVGMKAAEVRNACTNN